MQCFLSLIYSTLWKGKIDFRANSHQKTCNFCSFPHVPVSFQWAAKHMGMRKKQCRCYFHKSCCGTMQFGGCKCGELARFIWGAINNYTFFTYHSGVNGLSKWECVHWGMAVATPKSSVCKIPKQLKGSWTFFLCKYL